MNAQFSSVAEWLNWLETLHPQTIDLGLHRIERVRAALSLQPHCPVITVAGTNGKGSVCALLSTMLAAAGFRVGTYTSPHLLTFNERIRINMQPIDDADLLASFARIEAARGDVSLSYFEFGTLAAVDIFEHHRVDVMVLEVGLGGRLDAVNIFDADCALITSIDIDHSDWLGHDREQIGFEKAGIFRAGQAVICADPNPPQSVLHHAEALGCEVWQLGTNFSAQRTDHAQWCYQSLSQRRAGLPLPALRGQYQIQHAAAAIAALERLHPILPVDMQAIRRGLVEVEWPGRFQVLPGRPVIVLDVGHNPHAARALAENFKILPFAQRRFAVFSALADKDITGVIAPLRDEFDHWFIAPIAHERALSITDLHHMLNTAGITAITTYPQLTDAWHAALSQADENDRIAVFGSFFTVATVLEAGRP